MRGILADVLDDPAAGHDLVAAAQLLQNFLQGCELPDLVNYSAIAQRLWRLPASAVLFDLNDSPPGVLPQGIYPGAVVRVRGFPRSIGCIGSTSMTIGSAGRLIARVSYASDTVIPLNKSEIAQKWLYVLGRITRLSAINVRAASINMAG